MKAAAAALAAVGVSFAALAPNGDVGVILQAGGVGALLGSGVKLLLHGRLEERRDPIAIGMVAGALTGLALVLAAIL